MTASILNREIKLSNSPKEREQYENLADLYSIFKTTEAIEKAYVRDAITEDEFVFFQIFKEEMKFTGKKRLKAAITKLRTQFKSAEKLAQPFLPGGIQAFLKEYKANYEREIIF